MQFILLNGFLGQDPQMRYTPSGVPVTNFSLATSDAISKERVPECPGGWKESLNGKNWQLTTWWRVTCWRRLAETTNDFLAKGQQALVIGKVGGTPDSGNLNPTVWTDKSGVSRASFEITADKVEFGSKGGGNGAPAPRDEDAPPLSGADEQKLPF